MEENIKEAMAAAHDNMQEKMQEKVAEVKNTLDSLEGTSRANRFTVTGYTIYNAVLLACYLVEVIKGSRTGGYFAIFAVLSILPLAAIWIVYKRNPASENLKRILIYSYAVFYTFTIFTTMSPVAFVYGALVSLFVIVYGQKRLSFGAAGGIFLLNLIHVIYMAANGMITSQDLPNVEIRIGFTLLFALFMVMATNVIISNNEAKMKAITQEKESVSAMLEQILEISENMIGDILTVSEKMTTLEDSVTKTKASMEEVTEGEPMCIFHASVGTTVVAVASGTVMAVNDDETYGHSVWVDHGNGYITIYRNKGDATVAVGDSVVQGTTLFVIGEDNADLGYQMQKDGSYINPMDMLAISG